MRIVRLDPDGSFSHTDRLMILLGPKQRRDLTFVGLMLRLARRKTLYVGLILRPYIQGCAEIVRGM
jgi:hypothetical protein